MTPNVFCDRWLSLHLVHFVIQSEMSRQLPHSLVYMFVIFVWLCVNFCSWHPDQRVLYACPVFCVYPFSLVEDPHCFKNCVHYGFHMSYTTPVFQSTRGPVFRGVPAEIQSRRMVCGEYYWILTVDVVDNSIWMTAALKQFVAGNQSQFKWGKRASCKLLSTSEKWSCPSASIIVNDASHLCHIHSCTTTCASHMHRTSKNSFELHRLWWEGWD